MGLLIDGQWHDQWYDTATNDGAFKREASRFRNWVTSDGQPGPSGSGGFKAESDRYHLFISYACPWAHRTSIFRSIKGLTSVISMSTVSWYMGSEGWLFDVNCGGDPDPILSARCLHELYVRAHPSYTGRVTVPILWDRHRMTIVSNESSEIIRMMDSAFTHCGARDSTSYPSDLRTRIDRINEWVYQRINNGVYRAGFATEQGPYEEAVVALFKALDALEEHLTRYRYLLGPDITEADWRLLPTLLRFDAVYTTHFKCTLRRLVDYPNLWAYTRGLAQYPGVAETIRMDHIKGHYFQSHPTINPHGIIPRGPEQDFMEPDHRDLGSQNVPSESEIAELTCL